MVPVRQADCRTGPAHLTQHAAALDPTNEEVSRLAMKAHERVDDQTAADAELRRLRAALRAMKRPGSAGGLVGYATSA